VLTCERLSSPAPTACVSVRCVWVWVGGWVGCVRESVCALSLSTHTHTPSWVYAYTREYAGQDQDVVRRCHGAGKESLPHCDPPPPPPPPTSSACRPNHSIRYS
jgi:hypothetical protein